MTGNAGKTHVTAQKLDVGVADSCLADCDERFAFRRNRIGTESQYDSVWESTRYACTHATWRTAFSRALQTGKTAYHGADDTRT